MPCHFCFDLALADDPNPLPGRFVAKSRPPMRRLWYRFTIASIAWYPTSQTPV